MPYAPATRTRLIVRVGGDMRAATSRPVTQAAQAQLMSYVPACAAPSFACTTDAVAGLM